jgi:ATP-dependent DNA ligase
MAVCWLSPRTYSRHLPLHFTVDGWPSGLEPGRVCPGFATASVFEIEASRDPACPFVNLPETRRSRFGEELNAEKMKKAVWLKPEAVAQIEFLEWTEADRLRHSKFVGLREDKNPRNVVKEKAGEPE